MSHAKLVHSIGGGARATGKKAKNSKHLRMRPIPKAKPNSLAADSHMMSHKEMQDRMD